MIGCGAEMKPIRMPEDKTFDRLSKRMTRPTSGWSRSSVKYEGGRGALPKYK